MFARGNKRGQLAIFVIIAIVLAGGVATYVVVKEKGFISSIPAEFSPIYSYYEQCISQETERGLRLAGSQGGRIDVGEYVPGSEYAPFASQLNFLGFPVPYWYYVSANGVIREQAPSKTDIEQDLAVYLEEKITECDFDQFYARGFDIEFNEPEVNVKIEDSRVLVDVSQNVVVSNDNRSAARKNHDVEVQSSFGSLYNEARKIYNKQVTESFLENYSVDVLRLYAPVDGVEISCSPRIWKSREVAEELRIALEANIAAIKFKGNDYTLQNDLNKYFVVDENIDENVRLLYSKDWPSRIEIEGADGEIMIANPVGNQQGLGVLGFCYAPYHFVYDVSYPVMVQVYDSEEMFQFPVVVVIDGNLPREGAFSEIEGDVEQQDICEFANQDIFVSTFDKELNAVNASVSYVCFDQRCNLGETQDGLLETRVPGCINGYMVARAEGYAETKELFSSNSESSADLLLEKEYRVNVSLEVDGQALKDNALVSFNGKSSTSTMLPESRQVVLSEGFYNVSVSVYGNSSITIPAGSKTECVEVPRSGLSGFFGGSDEQCFEVSLPATKIEYALAGGGESEIYILESDLEDGVIKLEVEALPRPTSLEQLQMNYEIFTGMGVDLA